MSANTSAAMDRVVLLMANANDNDAVHVVVVVAAAAAAAAEHDVPRHSRPWAGGSRSW